MNLLAVGDFPCTERSHNLNRFRYASLYEESNFYVGGMGVFPDQFDVIDRSNYKEHMS